MDLALAGSTHAVGTARKIPAINAHGHADVIVNEMIVPDKPRELPHPVLLLPFLGAFGYAERSGSLTDSEQAFPAEVDISSRSA